MKSIGFQLLAVIVFLVLSNLFSIYGSLAASALIILLAVLTGAALSVYHSLLRSRRPARAVVAKRPRN